MLQNGFLENKINILKTLGLIRPPKSQQIKFAQDDSLKNDHNNLASDLEISFKLLNKAIRQQTNNETYNQNLHNDWDYTKIWVNKNNSIDELIQKINVINNGKDNDRDIEEQLQNFIEKRGEIKLNSKIKQFKDSLNKSDTKLFIEKLLFNNEWHTPNELENQQIMVAEDLEKKNLEIEMRYKKNKKIKQNELDERNKIFFKKKRNVEEENKNQDIKNEDEFLDSISFFSKQKEIHSDNFISNNFFSVHNLKRKSNIKKNSSSSQYSTKSKHKDYVSEVNLIVESLSIAKSPENANVLTNEFKEQIIFRKCNSEDNLLNETGSNKTCNIYIGGYDSKNKWSVYSNQKLDFGDNLFANKCIKAFNSHYKIGSSRKLNEDENINTFYNLTTNPFNENLLNKNYTKDFVKVEVLSAILSNTALNKPNQSSLILSNFNSQQDQTLPLINDGSGLNNSAGQIKLSLHKQFFIKKQTFYYLFKEKGIEPVESILKADNINQLYTKIKLKNYFLSFNNEFRDDLEIKMRSCEEDLIEKNEIAKEFLYNLTDLNQLSDATAYIHWMGMSEFFLQNKEISANELCNCNSIDLMQFSRLTSTANNAKFIKNYFEKEFNRILNNVLEKESYKNIDEGEKEIMEINFFAYAFIRISRAENFICKENNFSETDMRSHGVSNLPLHYFISKHIIKNPAYASLINDSTAEKNFNNLNDSGSANKAIFKILNSMDQGPVGL